MIKKQWKGHLNHLRNKGYLTHSMLLELYKEDEEIPEWFGKMLHSEPKEPEPFRIQCGLQTYEHFQKILNEVSSKG